MSSLNGTLIEEIIITDDVTITLDDTGGESAPLYVWLLLSFTAIVSFWFQAVLTEERFVPALNLIATAFNIPDDVAGATLMAAGASSPELFSSIVSLFITHSALGLGTIVGSEIFNQLMICTGSIYAARGCKLELDRAICAREVGFYALSIILLYVALRDRQPADDDATGFNHIYISFFDACLLFGGYIAYVLVCSYFEPICALFNYGGSETEGLVKRKTISLDIPTLPYIRQVKHEPTANWEDVNEPSSGQVVSHYGAMAHSVKQGGASMTQSSLGGTLTAFTHRAFVVTADRPSDMHDIYSLELNEYEESTSCFLWQRSRFYTKARITKHGWQLRWFTFTHSQIISVPDRSDFEKHKFKYPVFNEILVDVDHLLFKVNSAQGKSYEFMAPSAKILEQTVSKIEEIIKFQNSAEAKKTEPEFLDVAASAHTDETAHQEESLIAWPEGASYLGIVAHIILFPFKLAMHLTVPDTRHPGSLLSMGFMAVVSCLVWLVIGSYAMVASLEHLADLMSIPPAVVGVTVSAVGTSLPNYVGSQCAAKAGLGNMAVSNAFGSNTFNILVGLGLPWVLYIGLVSDGPYHGLKDEGITQMVIILAVVLLAFVVMVLMSNFVLYKWHANAFAVMYVAYLIFATAPYIF